MLNLNSIREIRDFLESRSLTLKKRWGQNFLVNPEARRRLVEELTIRKYDRVWEIGPGLGALTEGLLEKSDQLVVFEIDRGVIRYLEERWGQRPGLRIVEGDFIRTWEAELAASGAPDWIVGNLPYASASGMIGDLVVKACRPKGMLFTVQKEAAARMSAAPGRKDYSSFSILCQFEWKVSVVGELSPGSFYPPPEVKSSIVRFDPYPADADRVPADRSLFLDLVRRFFLHRRKTILHPMREIGRERGWDAERAAAFLRSCGIDPQVRAEALAVEDFIRVSDRLGKED